MITRIAAVALASTSFVALFAEMYRVVALRPAVCVLVLPALVVLGALAIRDRRGGDGALARDLGRGALGGVVAAVTYDLFRVPFVLAGMPLFAAFARFGEALSGQPAQHPLAIVLGWGFHFGNGASLGAMYAVAAPRAPWWGAVVWALAVEGALLVSPYAAWMGVAVGPSFIAVTLAAHLLFGVTLGLWLRRYRIDPQPAAARRAA